MDESNVWKNAQREEIIFWTLQNYDMVNCYKNKYEFFNDFLSNISKDKKVLDVGCGAIAVSLLYNNINNLTLCDSLVNEYLSLPDNKTNIKGKNAIQCKTEKLPFNDKQFDITLFLNTLDHVDNMEKSFNEVCRVTKDSILFYVDLRDTKEKTDGCHPNIITLDIVKDFINKNKFSIIDSKICKSSLKGIDCFNGILIAK